MDRGIWEQFVREAYARDDHAALRALFAQAEAAWGHQEASREWQELFSALDASAETG